MTESMQSKGGKARARALTAEQRSEIARRAAAARYSIPSATHAGELQIGTWMIPCYVLPDQRRMMSQRGFMDIIGMRGRKSIGHRIASFIDLPTLKSRRVKQLVMDTENPVRFLTPKGIIALGYEGTLIVDYCKALLDARRVGGLPNSSLKYAEAAEKFIVSLASVGIVALIDEATGYQEIRDRKALEALLDRYLRREFSAWAKRFPDDFYKEVFRLKGWSWQGMQVNRPSCVGRYTRDLVYSRLEVGILKELESRNPWIAEKKRRDGYHHTLLTEDFGVPALAQHLHTVITIMRGFKDSNWPRFLEFMDQVLPKKGDSVQMLLALGVDNGQK